MIHDWSIKRDPSTVNNKVWATEVEIDLKDFTDSHKWLFLKKDIVSKTMLSRKSVKCLQTSHKRFSIT